MEVPPCALVYEAMGHAHVAGDAEAASQFFSNDVVLLMPNAEPVVGKSAAREALEEWYRNAKIRAVSFDVKEITTAASGEWAFDIARYQIDYDAAHGTRTIEQGYHLVVWRREQAGSWMIARDVATIATCEVLPCANSCE